MLALIGQAVTSYAAAGVIGESSCCCPQPSKCKCHDHDGKSTSTELKRCSGEAKLVAPAVATALPAIDLEVSIVPRASTLPADVAAPLPDDISREPEKPPF